MGYPTVSSAGVRVVNIGTGKDYATLRAFNDNWLKNQNLVTNAEMVYVYTGQDENLAGADFGPISASDAYHCVILPMIGAATADLDATGPLDYSGVGIEITFSTNSTFRHKNGVVFEGFRTHYVGTGTGGWAVNHSKYAQSGANSKYQGYRKCRMLVDSLATSNIINTGDNGGVGLYEDCLVIFGANSPSIHVHGFYNTILRCTFVRRGLAGNAIGELYNSYMADCAFVNMQTGAVKSLNNTSATNCVSDSAADTGRGGFTVATGLLAGAADFRPAANGPLIGKASASAASTSDVRNSNRGAYPDVGAAQLANLPPTPSGKVTDQSVPDGQRVVIKFSTTYNPTSGSASMVPAAGNAAGVVEFVGVVTIDAATNTGEAVFDPIPAGIYDPLITLTGAGGIGKVTGTTQVAVIGITGSPQAPGVNDMPVAKVTAVVVSPAVAVGAAKFSAVVQGENSPSQSVIWGAEAGQIDTAGNFTPPAATSVVQKFRVSAKSAIDGTVIGYADITIPAKASITSITVVPSTKSMSDGETFQFACGIQGVNSPPTDVDWTASTGSVSATGVYAAEATDAVQTVTITATSKFDPTFKASATITIAAKVSNVPVVTGVSITPKNAVIRGGAVQQYEAKVDGIHNPSQQVDWSSDLGMVNAEGLLLAPEAKDTEQSGSVTATSRLDPRKSATVSFSVPANVASKVGTLVEFRFITPEGVPIKESEFEIQLRTADSNEGIKGVMMPRLIRAVTDNDGTAIVDLIACDTLYYVTMSDPVSDVSLAYKFYVPQMDDPTTVVRLQDIVVQGELPPLPYDQAALLTILNAKATAVAAKVAAEAAAAEAKAVALVLSGPDGASKIGYKGGTVADALDNGTGGGGSGGSVNNVETSVTAVNAEFTLDKTKGVNYRMNLTSNVKLLNPVGFQAGDIIRLIVQQDAAGARNLSYDNLFSLPGAQVPLLSQAPKSIDKLIIDVSQGESGLEYLVTPQINNYSVVLPLAYINDTIYYKLSGADNMGALNKIKPGETVFINRNGNGAEATGTIDTRAVLTPNPSYVIAGKVVNGVKPLLKLTADIRPSFGKAVLNFEGNLTVEISDLRISGVRNSDGDARGIAMNASANAATPFEQHLVIRRVEIDNCNNGLLSGNEALIGSLLIEDSLFNKNGVGSPDAANSHGTGTSNGFVHNVYMGRSKAPMVIRRSTFNNSVTGHNLKSRSVRTELYQVSTDSALEGRELNLPNGGVLYAENCTFRKPSSGTQGNLIGIGEETIDTSRERKYTFKNVRFTNEVTGGGKDATFIINFDRDVPMEFIDCEFIGDSAKGLNGDPNNKPEYAGMTTKAGIRYYPTAAPIFTLTGGPIGPILTPGVPPETLSK